MLNQRGERDAPMMGRHLVQQRINPDLVLSSPAQRALRTAALLVQEMGFPVDRIVTNAHIYDAEVVTLVDIIQQIDERFNDVLLVGHNPSMHDLTSYLTGQRIPSMPTCSVFCINLSLNAWQEVAPGCGSMVFFHYPRH